MVKKKNKTGQNGIPAKPKEQYVINQIIVKSPQRKVYDVGTWRTALVAADSDRVKQLYDLFDDIIIDAVLGDAIQKRIDAVTNSELTFQNANGEEVDEISDLIDTLAWEDLLTEIVKAKIWGRSGVEMGFSGEFSVAAIPAKHIDLKNRTILIRDIDERGVPFDGDQQILVIGKNHDYGLLLKATPYAIWKRGGFGDWAQWIELFGMPQRIGKYNTYDPESRKLLEDAFEKSGSAPYVVIPKEADVETKEAGTGSGSSYNEFRQALNEEILITLLGQTMTTVQGEKGARSLGEVHKDVEESKNKSDLRFVQRILNSHVLPMLEARGYPVAGGKFIFPKAAEQLKVSEVVELSGIMDIPQSYLHEKYAIPVAKDGELIAGRKTSVATLEDTPDEPITNSDRNILMRLWDFFVAAPQDGATYGKAHIMLSDNSSFEQRLAARVANGDTRHFDAALYIRLSSDFLNAVQTVFKRDIHNADMGFAYSLRDDAMKTAMEMNLYHFSAGKTLAEVQELNKIFRSSKNYTEFSKKAEEVCETFNKKWQKTEYDTAYLSAQSAAEFQRLMKKVDLFPYWKYVTAGDENVREEHRKLDGIILPANDPRWKKIFPPNGWRCRCLVLPLMKYQVKGIDIKAMQERVDKYFLTSEWKMNAAQGWDSNRAETGEIFSKNQQYIRKFPDKANARLGELYYNDYGLESFGKKLGGATGIALEFTGDAKEWYKSHQVFEDYKGRNVQLLPGVFEKHTTKKYEPTRVPLLGCIQDVLKSPDEIWLNDYQTEFRNLNFIKFYEGRVIVVICEVKGGNLYQVTTWFEIEKAATLKEGGRQSRKIDPRWRYRRGLLIKKA